jgi:oxygen-dependent protoporphyrinogen oxidase
MTGIAAAYEIASSRPDIQLTLLESRTRLGGNVQTIHRDGFLLDGGPDSFIRTKVDTANLCEELGLGGQLIGPEPLASRVYIGKHGKLLPLPAGMALAVPTRLRPLLETRLVSFWGKLRILGDLFIEKDVPRSDASDETVAAFLERHFGREVTSHLAGPLLGGIFAGDIEELSIHSTFPQLVALEQQQGSLIRALFAAERLRAAQAQGEPVPRNDDLFDPVELFSLYRWLRRTPPSTVASPFQTLQTGMGTLIEQLERKLPPACLRLGRSVRSLARKASGYTLTLDGDERLECDAVLVCVPAHAAANLLSTLPNDALSNALRGIPYVSTATVFFALKEEPKQQPLDSAGFIVPRGEGRLLASTWLSTKWAGRAPAGNALIRVFLGGAREPNLVEASTDEELLTLAKDEIRRYLGPLDDITRFTQVFRWVRSNPQPTLGHAARLAVIDSAVKEGLPGLALAGSAYDGVGLGDCIRQGRAAARRVLSVRAAHG